MASLTEFVRCPNCGLQEGLRIHVMAWLAYGEFAVAFGQDGNITYASPPRVTCTVKRAHELIADYGTATCYECGHTATLAEFGIRDKPDKFIFDDDVEDEE